MNLLTLVIVIFGLTAIALIGAWIGYSIYNKNKPKQETWIANVYSLSDGVKKHGNYYLNDLIPYSKDVILKQENEDGTTVYTLKHLAKSVKEVTADVVQNWGKEKTVNVLLKEGQCTLLKYGYDKKIGEMIYKPMQRERMEMIKSDMAEKKNRVKEKRSTLLQALPYIVAAIGLICLIGTGFLITEAYVKIADKLNDMVTKMIEYNEKRDQEFLNNIAALYNQTKTSPKSVNPSLINAPAIE